ncbi:MAG: tRNA (adenosine(37)-N6)-threonylcarbamoyltransferase complex ATPase subunit type 1 TsaE [Bacteroidetes bacterium]|nr:tRNA (adenosine(37)-N6)-threonylcarbamoyltransferase complex ATPase subunit type 1 TsaE [Bacteroidota bacterium]
MEKRIAIQSLNELPQAAGIFLGFMGDFSVIAFSGEMGAGKTTFIQSLCRALGVPEDVNSPTFALVNEYFTAEGESLFHFDLYRIEDPDELFDMGYEEYFFSGKKCFIEWPEKAGHLIPDDALMVHIEVKEDGSRELRFELPGK